MRQERKASLEERKGINLLQADPKERLRRLHRAENLSIQQKKERTRTSLYQDPFRFVKGLFTKEKSGSLTMLERDLEDHLKTTRTDDQRHEQTDIPPDMPPIP